MVLQPAERFVSAFAGVGARPVVGGGRAVVAFLPGAHPFGELGLLRRPASQETLEKLTKTLDDAHTARARLGAGESNVIGPDDIDKLPEPAKRLVSWALSSFHKYGMLWPVKNRTPENGVGAQRR